MSLLTPDPGLLFWMLLCFGVVFFVLAKFGWPIIVKMVDERKAYIDQSLESAKQANLELATIKQQGESILNEAREEQAKILKEANEMRLHIIHEAKEQASEEASKVMDEARLGIEKEKELALRDVQNQIALLSLDIAEKVLRRNLVDESSQLELVNKLIEESNKN
ncbi:F0F1 ATP synthase subunit B [Bacteroidales bacterium OttesenSCG-928-L03]|nr:F0F1 ATP synthase subunit B [Bacteroidales bacterium OttesenSCG-928-L03]